MNPQTHLTRVNNAFTIHAHCKLNLGLRVFPARPDGFHDLETWMIATSWHDTITTEPADQLSLHITGRSAGIPTEPEKNLAGRAALALAKSASILPRARITLHKVLPPGGGIGGGSADAASTLLALNALWNLNFPTSQLAPIAASLGSDIPFFLEATPALCTGRGEIMTPLLPRHPLFAVLIIPPMGCPTKDVYQGFDAGRQHSPQHPRTDWQKCANATADQLNTLLVNDLEPSAFHVAPALADLRTRAQTIAQQPIHLTGSGSTLFTLCSSSTQTEALAKTLSQHLPPDIATIPVALHT